VRPRARFGNRLRGARGTTLIEAAFITPLFLLLTFSIVDFGSLFYCYLALENGVSQASRYGVTGNQLDDPDNPGEVLTREDSIKAAMRTATPTLRIDDGAFSFEHRAPGAGAWSAGVGGPGDIDKVTINYTWRFMTPLIRVFFTDGQINLRVESAMKNEGRFE
jgi:Flp pilus assembly protein TadG